MQLELPGRLGLGDGRYLIRPRGEDERGDGPDADEAERVLILTTIGARRPVRRRRRARRVDGGEQPTVPITRATVAHSLPLGDARAASAWLEAIASDVARRTAEVRAAVRLVNRALHAARAAARDPLVADVGASRALAVRIGYGSGDQLADGRWTEARELPPPPSRGRAEEVDPQQRVAAVLGGREDVHPAETLLVRARLDLELGRTAEAALEIAAAERALRRGDGGDGDPEELRARIEALLREL